MGGTWAVTCTPGSIQKLTLSLTDKEKNQSEQPLPPLRLGPVPNQTPFKDLPVYSDCVVTENLLVCGVTWIWRRRRHVTGRHVNISSQPEKEERGRCRHLEPDDFQKYVTLPERDRAQDPWLPSDSMLFLNHYSFFNSPLLCWFCSDKPVKISMRGRISNSKCYNILKQLHSWQLVLENIAMTVSIDWIYWWK